MYVENPALSPFPQFLPPWLLMMIAMHGLRRRKKHIGQVEFLFLLIFSILIRCAWLGELDSAEESDEISNEFDFKNEVYFLNHIGFDIIYVQ